MGAPASTPAVATLARWGQARTPAPQGCGAGLCLHRSSGIIDGPVRPPHLEISQRNSSSLTRLTNTLVWDAVMKFLAFDLGAESGRAVLGNLQDDG